MKKLSLEEFQKRLEEIWQNDSLEAIDWDGAQMDAVVQCKKCGQIFIKKGQYFLDKRKVSICKKCFPTQSNVLKENFILPKGYSYIEPYKGMHNKVLIKHNECGFIWKVTPANLKIGKGCPKCNKKISKGEQKIINWLQENKIAYEMQKPIKIKEHNLIIDFFLPSYNLYIEYNGEQHYHPVNYFGGKQKFLIQQYHDDLKRSTLQKNLIEIPYTFFNDIEKILKSSTTISKESTQQALAVEVKNLLKKENDIVSTSNES